MAFSSKNNLFNNIRGSEQVSKHRPEDNELKTCTTWSTIQNWENFNKKKFLHLKFGRKRKIYALCPI